MDQGTQSKAKAPEISCRKRSAARGAVDGQQGARALCGGLISRVSALSVLAPGGGIFCKNPASIFTQKEHPDIWRWSAPSALPF